MNRSQSLQLTAGTDLWDILVIGGGATGLGVAVDAAARGFKTLLLEAKDFAQGTSSRSTKLVHGGVRYLEQGDIPLVLEALRERGLLHRNAPHLVHHQSFIVPSYKWWEGPFFGIGLKVYDALAGKLNLAKSRMISREETIARIPNISQEHLIGGVEYFDGQFDDSRLAITLAETATRLGATLLNHARVISLIKKDGHLCGAEFTDNESGRSCCVRARCVINATGIFADSIRLMENPAAAPAVRPSQGIHLVFDRSFLCGDSAIMVPHTDDGRVLFVIPWHGRVLVGTTDTPMEKPDAEPRATRDEIRFVLRNAARYLAKVPTERDVLSVFAGQRPLVRPPGKDGAPTKAISRNHEVLVSDAGLVTIVGGKWTTYRKMAEDTIDHAITLAGLDDRPCATRDLHLHGWRCPENPQDVLEGYGSDRELLEDLTSNEPALGELLHPALPYPRACVVHAAKQEMARTLEDVLARRTRALFLDARAAAECAPDAAALLARELGKDRAWAAEQTAAFQMLTQNYLPEDQPSQCFAP